ncbi:MAG: hypothetical protein RIQ93_2601 [Verrucomicrobiota bacterium]|jgi:hypothetical protein
MRFTLLLLIAALQLSGGIALAGERPIAPSSTAGELRLATFDIDATPPLGSWMAYDRVINQWDLGLRIRGIVLLGAGQPIVLCAVDWIGIANESHDAFRQTLATAVNTDVSRVAVHTLHQHDAPASDFTAEAILRKAGVEPSNTEGSFARETLRRLAVAVQGCLVGAKPVTEIGLGQAEVREVASNRRILGPDGKVSITRYTATRDPAVRALPEGVIDPVVSLVSFWNAGEPVAVLSYYACHPQSYYRTGVANPDFPGIARFLRQIAVPQALHVHFNGAGGNLGAGKYNDGAPENRRLLGERLADGMRRAWEATRREPINAKTVGWRVAPVSLPPASHLTEKALGARLDAKNGVDFLAGAASQLAWLRRCVAGHKIDIACLSVGRARILHLPGELFVEYQLQAKAEHPDLFIAMAAYGDFGPGYIGTAVAYEQGGYETGPGSSLVAPSVEPVLTTAVRQLLQTSP